MASSQEVRGGNGSLIRSYVAIFSIKTMGSLMLLRSGLRDGLQDLNDLMNARMIRKQNKTRPTGIASKIPRMIAGTMTSLPQGLLRSSMNQRVKRSVQRAFQGRDFSKSAKGFSDWKGGIVESEAFPPRLFPLDDDASSPADFSAVTISSISMVLLSGKSVIGIWFLNLRISMQATLGEVFCRWPLQ